MKYTVMSCIDGAIEEEAFAGSFEECLRHIDETLERLLYKGWSIERMNEPTTGCRWWSIQDGEIILVPEDATDAGLSFLEALQACRRHV